MPSQLWEISARVFKDFQIWRPSQKPSKSLETAPQAEDRASDISKRRNCKEHLCVDEEPAPEDVFQLGAFLKTLGTGLQKGSQMELYTDHQVISFNMYECCDIFWHTVIRPKENFAGEFLFILGFFWWSPGMFIRPQMFSSESCWSLRGKKCCA